MVSRKSIATNVNTSHVIWATGAASFVAYAEMSCHLNLRRSDGWMKLLRRLPLTKMVKDELMWLEPNRSESDFFAETFAA